jgi:heme/copper-type cytochrome/quinol oxidase subunit 3
MIFVEMSTTYWHFLAGLWVYLFITLYFYNI